MKTHPSKRQLVDAIADATRAAYSDLLRANPHDSFYYVSLITTGEGHAPFLSAWSHEALARQAAGDAQAQAELKWSYADSPFCFFGEEYFEPVNRLFEDRPQPEPEETQARAAEFQVRIDAMEAALARLEAEGLFGNDAERRQMVVNAEVMPPDYTNVERARRLNPVEALTDWLAEAAESDI